MNEELSDGGKDEVIDEVGEALQSAGDGLDFSNKLIVTVAFDRVSDDGWDDSASYGKDVSHCTR